MAKSKHEPFVVGWLFWGIVFLVLLAPSIYVCWKVIDPEESKIIPVGAGSLLSALCAGFVAWGANAAYQWFERRRKIETRKTSKKR